MTTDRDDLADPKQTERDRDLRQLAHQSGLNLAGSFVAAALNLALPVLITRTLDKGDAGVFFQATALFTIVLTISTLGADTGLVRFLPRAIAQHRPDDVRATLKVSLGPPLAFSILLAVLLALTSGPLGDLATGDSDSLASTFSGAILVLSVVLPVATVYLLGLAASRGFGAIMPLVVIEKIGRGSTQVVVSAVALMATTSVLWLTLAWAAPYVAALIVLVLWTLDRTRKVVANLTAGRVQGLLGRTAAGRHHPRRRAPWPRRRRALHRRHPLPDSRADVRPGDPAGDGPPYQ
jgi:O-antigen/teichoic acid export membrane protein